VITFTLNINDGFGNTWTDSFKIKIPGPPLEPGDFNGTAKSPTSILWTWTDNSDDETGFHIHDTNNNVKVVSLPANSNSWLETGLEPNTSYTRHVNAANSYGGKDSNSAPRYTLSLPPANLSANGNLIESSIALYWTGNGGTKYSVERAMDFNGLPAAWSTIKYWKDNVIDETYVDSNLTGNTKYWYRIKSYNGDGVISDIPSNEKSAITLPGSAISKPKVEVYNNLINPMKNQAVYITCNLPQDGNLTVVIYDFSGNVIKKIVDNEHKNSGMNIFEWAGKNYDNEIVASGSYMVYIKIGNYIEKKKILIIK